MNSFDGEGGSKGMDEYVFSVIFFYLNRLLYCSSRYQCLTRLLSFFLVGMIMIGEMTLIWIS